ncbi:MAG: HD domain-containing protein [Anaerolineaceae bacterium]|nr:HD domain-containing protein [Anaerolineaceae bacterium]
MGRRESFWLDCVSGRIYSVLLDQVADWPLLTINEKTIEPIAEMFAHVVDAASGWTATHTAGVAASAVALAERLNFSPRELLLMRAAGYFHDLGKLTVPSHILDKPGKLDPREWNIMKGHTYHTFRILNTIGGMPQMSEWAAFHHERLDGNGYPFHHDGKDLTLGARIMAVADVFTAISEDRPYRRGMPRAKALSILDNQARQGALDADIVSVLKANYDQIDATRREKQAVYARTQQQLARVIGQPATAANHEGRLQQARASS